MNRRSYCFIVLVTIASAIGYGAESGSVTLEAVRERVARNEALLNPIKMTYTVKKSRTGERARSSRGGSGRSFSHINYVWAQAGEKHFAREDYFYGPNEPASSMVCIIDSHSMIRGDLPDLMKGYISPREDHDWYSVLVAKLGLRPFEGHYTLSQILVPEYACLHEKTEMIDGRETYVIDAKRPSAYPYFARIWIDRQRGMPLRIWYYGRHPNWSDARRIGEINDIKHHRLPNGGWVPIQGVRSINFSEDNISYEHMTVDVNSITIRREDIPESLFQIDFPEGAGIYNVISGLTTVKGKPFKTYEQVVNTGNSCIAGTVVDDNGSPVPGIVVGPHEVKTKQSNGRFNRKAIQGYDRPCAVTDMEGRFAIELDEKGLYDLWVFPEYFVDIMVSNVPLGKHDLKMTLHKGGTVTGRVVRLRTGRKTPVPNVEVTAKTEGRGSNDIRFGRTRTETDSEGRFQIKYLEMLMPKRGTGDSQPQQYVPRAWQIQCGSASETVLFEESKTTQDVELVLKPNLGEAEPLIGRVLPGFEGIKIDLTAGQSKDKMMLVCFFDMNQRPSRNFVLQLAKQAELLEQQGVGLAAVQAVKMGEDTLRKWVRENNVPFPIGMIQDDEECVRFDWAVCSQPWLILTDADHVVRVEGLGLDELEDKIREAKDTKRL